MYQVHHAYVDECGLDAFADDLQQRVGSTEPGEMLFHVYSNKSDLPLIDSVRGQLGSRFPGAHVIGATTDGNLLDGALTAVDESPSVSIACNVFEDADTRIETMQLPLDYGTQEATAAALARALEERPWATAVEMLTTVADVHMLDFCENLSKVRPGIKFFGGAAFCTESADLYSGLPRVFSAAHEPAERGVVFVLYGGSNLFVETRAVTGWKPLGLSFEITRAERAVIYELNGSPAFDAYHYYLQLENDDEFFANSIVFPLAFDHEGMTVLKSPTQSNPDGSLLMTSDLSKEHRSCRIAYGNASIILDEIRDCAQHMRAFAPQGIFAYSCASRLFFWGSNSASNETLPFNALAPTAGFFTASEFIRHHDDVLQHNVTLVLAGLREGPARELAPAGDLVDGSGIDRNMKIMKSLTAFISKTSEELQDAYDEMERMAKTDIMTGLLARWETERIIGQALEETEEPLSLIMCDIDDFKHINDTFGHAHGDEVLRALGSVLRTVPGGRVADAQPGRWGGEEFMVVLPHAPLDVAGQVAEDIRATFERLQFDESGSHTLSAGVAQAQGEETVEQLCSRVDKALYQAKREGKNRVVAAYAMP